MKIETNSRFNIFLNRAIDIV